MFELLGITGIAISVLAYLPQVVHLARERCSAGVSSRAWMMWLLSSLLIGALAIHRHDLVFILLQISSLTSAAIILSPALRYRGMVCETHARVRGKATAIVKVEPMPVADELCPTAPMLHPASILGWTIAGWHRADGVSKRRNGAAAAAEWVARPIGPTAAQRQAEGYLPTGGAVVTIVYGRATEQRDRGRASSCRGSKRPLRRLYQRWETPSPVNGCAACARTGTSARKQSRGCTPTCFVPLASKSRAGE